LDASQLSRVLFLGAGVVRTSQRRGRTWLFRAAGSAGGRFPLEVYASTKGVAGVPDGVHWYDPVEHALRCVGPPATGEATTLVVTGVPWRTGQKYAERGWRHLYWDAGTLVSQVVTAASSAGLDPQLRTLFPDRQVSELVGADGVQEFPLLLVSLGVKPPAVQPSGPATQGGLPEIEFPLVTAAQRSGDRDVLGPAWPLGAPLPDVPDAQPFEQVVLRRGSQRRMNRSATVPREKLDWPMRAAMRGIDLPHWVAVHGVDGVAPGVYRWPDLGAPIRTSPRANSRPEGSVMLTTSPAAKSPSIRARPGARRLRPCSRSGSMRSPRTIRQHSPARGRAPDVQTEATPSRSRARVLGVPQHA
jgi:SagB-type dehydrogenase family enzyme